jgi:hypothetical protein
VSCRGGGLTFTLDETSQGSLDVRLRQGGAVGFADTCFGFGGTVVRDVQAAPNGSFVARNALAPNACP